MKNFLILISMFCICLNVNAQDGLDARIQATYEVEKIVEKNRRKLILRMKEKGAFEKLDSIPNAYARKTVIEIAEIPYFGSKRSEYFFRKEVSVYIKSILDGPNPAVAHIKKNRDTYLRLKNDFNLLKLK